MRDKLIELIQNAVGGCARHWAELIADALIANGVTMQQWIPVSERLPEKTGWYRVCHKSKLISDRYFYSDSPEAFARFGSDPVTHWKPIEEPPKEGE